VKLFVLCTVLVVGINVLFVDKTRKVVLNYTMNDSTHGIIGKDLIKDKILFVIFTVMTWQLKNVSVELAR
jgi:hypothetical protein